MAIIKVGKSLLNVMYAVDPTFSCRATNSGFNLCSVNV